VVMLKSGIARRPVTLSSQVEYLLSITEDCMKEALTIYDALDVIFGASFASLVISKIPFHSEVHSVVTARKFYQHSKYFIGDSKQSMQYI
jgi:hypothetical protein